MERLLLFFNIIFISIFIFLEWHDLIFLFFFLNLSITKKYSECLFLKLKFDLRQRKLTNDEELISTMLNHFRDKNSEYFFDRIEKLIRRSKKNILN